jgi:hypothetical protein
MENREFKLETGKKLSKRIKFWKKIHGENLFFYGTAIHEDKTHYLIIPDDDIRPYIKHPKYMCDILE